MKGPAILPLSPGEHSCEEQLEFGNFHAQEYKELDGGKQIIQSTSCCGVRPCDSLWSPWALELWPAASLWAWCLLCQGSWNPGPHSQTSPLRATSSFLVLDSVPRG